MTAPHANIPADWADDPYWTAAVCLLHPIDAGRPFTYATGHGIDFPAMLDAGWSGGERRVIEAAASLWDGSVTVALLDLVAALDEPNWTRLCQAMAMLRAGLR